MADIPLENCHKLELLQKEIATCMLYLDLVGAYLSAISILPQSRGFVVTYSYELNELYVQPISLSEAPTTFSKLSNFFCQNSLEVIESKRRLIESTLIVENIISIRIFAWHV